MKPGKFPGMGGMNMASLMKQAQKMQQDMAKLQEDLANREYSASAGGGAVTATVRGTNELISLAINPEVVDPEDMEILQDLIMAAVNEALRTASETSASEMQKVTGGASLPGLF
jgi:nucleoid-associated protein EbfC